MAIETSLSRTWRNRQLMLAGFLAAFGLWFFYDGAIGYPKANDEFAAYKELEAAGRENEWPEISREKGWHRTPPDHSYDASQIRQQFILGGVAMAGALFALGLLAVNLKRRIRSDDEAVYSEKGTRVPLEAFSSVDRKKWDSKGIALAFYEESGRRKKFVIDDYKFQGGEKILEQIEARIAAKSA